MDIANYIDHTCLKAEAEKTEIRTLVDEAMIHGFASVCVNGSFVKAVSKTLRSRQAKTKTCSVVGFPLGAMSEDVKKIEATVAAKDGSEEIDFVGNLPNLVKGDVEELREDFSRIVKEARAVNPEIVVKVIIESAFLMKDVTDAEAERRIAAACQAAIESGVDFVKTSTGFHGAGGASVEAVKLMRKHATGIKVKASGGIRSYEDAMTMIDAGADRLGCSAGVAIVTGAAAKSDGY
ncbi:deoxyribose-phosphate aldolase [Poriferisphaera sp. WC338]|uniref:deoxyribose-phosphate aldolase n=1 Tax=Poriferisphaera sp. WC338 TaxID=3425129 RepID=UPI003D8125C7